MAFYLRSKKLDFSTGYKDKLVAVFNEDEGHNYGIQSGDKIMLKWDNKKEVVADAQFTKSKVKPGEIGLFQEIWKKYDLDKGDLVEVEIASRPLSIQSLKKLMLGKKLNYDEIYSIISDIVDNRLGDIEMTYFTASSFVRPYTNQELYYLTKAIAETGEQIDLPQKVVDKHSVGGLAGNRTTMIVIPIIASLGLTIPKTSSRAITSPSGTADTMEVLAPVGHTMQAIRKIIKKTGGCMVWGGAINMAPADDKIIRVSHPLSMEPYDKMLVSIMAKKVAMGVDHLIIDMPYGQTAKIPNMKTVKELEAKFKYLGKKFGMKVKVIPTLAKEPIGRGIGPALEARDVLRVLQRHELRPKDLEKKAVMLSAELLELKKFCKKGEGVTIAQRALDSGNAWDKMNEIIVAQGGEADLNSEEIVTGALRYEIHAAKSGKISFIDNRAVNEICINLGAPADKIAGIHLHVRFGQKVKKGDKLFTLYASNKDRLNLGKAAANRVKIFYVGNKGIPHIKRSKLDDKHTSSRKEKKCEINGTC